MVSTLAGKIAAEVLHICSDQLSRGAEACVVHLLAALPALAAVGAACRHQDLAELLCSRLAALSAGQRRAAAIMLGYLGEAAVDHPRAVPELERRCLDRDGETAAAAIRALERLSPHFDATGTVIRAIVVALSGKADVRRPAALSALATLSRAGHGRAVEQALRRERGLDLPARAAVARRLADESGRCSTALQGARLGGVGSEHPAGEPVEPRSLPRAPDSGTLEEPEIRRLLEILSGRHAPSVRQAAAMLADQSARGVRIFATPSGYRVRYLFATCTPHGGDCFS